MCSQALHIPSEEQGFGNPCGYMSKGLEGRGQGIECLTPHKPLPMTEGRGIPSPLLWVSPVMFVGICHITNMVSMNKCFLTQRPPSSRPAVSPPSPTTTTSGNRHSTTPPPPLHTSMTMAVWQRHVTAPYAHCFGRPGTSDVACCLDSDDAW